LHYREISQKSGAENQSNFRKVLVHLLSAQGATGPRAGRFSVAPHGFSVHPHRAEARAAAADKRAAAAEAMAACQERRAEKFKAKAARAKAKARAARMQAALDSLVVGRPFARLYAAFKRPT
jgi:hypothetical protein